MTLFENVAERARKRALYRRTLAELRGLPNEVARDLNIYHGDMRRIAREAVYNA